MIAELAIATSALAIFDDIEGVDYNELFQRAILLRNRDLLLDHLDEEQEQKLIDFIWKKCTKLLTGQKKDGTRVIRTEPSWSKEAISLFLPESEYRAMTTKKQGCVECGSANISFPVEVRTSGVSRSAKKYVNVVVIGARCNECNHVVAKYEIP